MRRHDEVEPNVARSAGLLLHGWSTEAVAELERIAKQGRRLTDADYHRARIAARGLNRLRALQVGLLKLNTDSELWSLLTDVRRGSEIHVLPRTPFDTAAGDAGDTTGKDAVDTLDHDSPPTRPAA